MAGDRQNVNLRCGRLTSFSFNAKKIRQGEQRMQPIFTPEGEQAFELFIEIICGVIVFIVTINVITWLLDKIIEADHDKIV
jgi:F0F1-type ATP synthase assembly protein I